MYKAFMPTARIAAAKAAYASHECPVCGEAAPPAGVECQSEGCVHYRTHCRDCGGEAGDYVHLDSERRCGWCQEAHEAGDDDARRESWVATEMDALRSLGGGM